MRTGFGLVAFSAVLSIAACGCGTENPEAASVGTAGGAGTAADGDRFSFFVTSLRAMRQLSGSQDGFGGDLRYGHADGLSGADAICRDIAEATLPGSGAKGWRAFLSASRGPDGAPVHAIARIGDGPWYDRIGRLVATSRSDLPFARPKNAASAIANDLPNEDGVPNHTAGAASERDNHDVLTGSDRTGRLAGDQTGSQIWPAGGATPANPTCNDWSSAEASAGRPIVGHSWPGDGVDNWIAGHAAPGCAPGVVPGTNQGFGTGQGSLNCGTVGCQGGYGAIYCFALTP